MSFGKEAFRVVPAPFSKDLLKGWNLEAVLGVVGVHQKIGVERLALNKTRLVTQYHLNCDLLPREVRALHFESKYLRKG